MTVSWIDVHNQMDEVLDELGEKLFINPRLLRLMARDSNDTAPYRAFTESDKI